MFLMRIEGKSIIDLKMLIMQKHSKTNCFSMISRVGVFLCSKKKLAKIHDKARSKTDMHVRWIFDRFLIDFGWILESKIDQKSIKQGDRKSMRIKMQAKWPRKRQPEALATISTSVFGPGKRVGGRVNPSQKA